MKKMSLILTLTVTPNKEKMFKNKSLIMEIECVNANVHFQFSTHVTPVPISTVTKSM